MRDKLKFTEHSTTHTLGSAERRNSIANLQKSWPLHSVAMFKAVEFNVRTAGPLCRGMKGHILAEFFCRPV